MEQVFIKITDNGNEVIVEGAGTNYKLLGLLKHATLLLEYRTLEETTKSNPVKKQKK